MKKRNARLGSIISGTMLKSDLIPEFCYELRRLGARDKELTRIERQCARVNSDKYYESESADYDLDWLFDKLGEYAPAWSYFGSHPGDGSDYGFWVSDALEYDFDGLKISDLSELPAKYTGEALLINDHGNLTLYNVKNGRYTDVWAIV